MIVSSFLFPLSFSMFYSSFFLILLSKLSLIFFKVTRHQGDYRKINTKIYYIRQKIEKYAILLSFFKIIENQVKYVKLKPY